MRCHHWATGLAVWPAILDFTHSHHKIRSDWNSRRGWTRLLPWRATCPAVQPVVTGGNTNTFYEKKTFMPAPSCRVQLNTERVGYKLPPAHDLSPSCSLKSTSHRAALSQPSYTSVHTTPASPPPLLHLHPLCQQGVRNLLAKKAPTCARVTPAPPPLHLHARSADKMGAICEQQSTNQACPANYLLTRSIMKCPSTTK